MHEKEKELISIGLTFILEYISNNDNKPNSDISDLRLLFNRVGKRFFKTKKEVNKSIESVYKKLETITNGEDVDCNLLNLSMNCLYLLMEYNVLKGSEKITANRLMKSIEPILVKNGDSVSIRNSYELMSKLDCLYKGE